MLQQIVYKRRQKSVKMDDSTLDTVHKAEGDPVHSLVILCGVGKSNQEKITYIFAASTNGHTPSSCHLKALVISATVYAGSHTHTCYSKMLEAFLCVHFTSRSINLRLEPQKRKNV